MTGVLKLRHAMAIGLVAAVAGCGGDTLRKELGLVGEGPDEFAVVSRKPLVMPETREALPTPDPGAPSRVDFRPTEEAAAALGKDPLATSATVSAGEDALLTGASADQIDPEVRALLEAEAVQTNEDERILDRLLGDTQEIRDQLDADEETRRLAAEARAGKNPELVVPEPPQEE